MTVKDAVTAAAGRYQLSAELLAAQVLVESSGQPDAFRFEPAFYKTYVKGNPNAKAARFGPLAACSYGPLQILLETAVEIGFAGEPEELFIPEIGMNWGAKYLASLLTWANGEYEKAWSAFNGGEGLGAEDPVPEPDLHRQDLCDERETADDINDLSCDSVRPDQPRDDCGRLAGHRTEATEEEAVLHAQGLGALRRDGRPFSFGGREVEMTGALVAVVVVVIIAGLIRVSLSLRCLLEIESRSWE